MPADLGGHAEDNATSRPGPGRPSLDATDVTPPRADTDEQRKAYAALGKAFGNA